VVRVVDEQNERFYLVDRQGVLVAAEYFPRAEGDRVCLQAEAIHVAPTVPSDRMFTAESLSQSFVGGEYRRAPEGPRGDLWMSNRSCWADS